MIRKIYYSIGLVFVVIGMGITWLAYDIKQFMSTSMSIPADGLIIKVKSGSNLTRIANHLDRINVITQPRYLIWYARWTSQATKIHIGEYKLEASATPETFLTKIAMGDVVQYSVTIVEGWNFKQVRETLKSNHHLTHTITDKTNEQIMQALDQPGLHPEGRFMPDTYHFPRGEKDVDVLKRAFRSMKNYLAKSWGDRDVGIPIKNPYEVLILASIVEKETGLATERATIAGVFSRRLIKRMRLQSDPTVIYGMGARYKGNIRRSDLKEKTAYNTYRIFGLPPTPIAMPGREAINAVLRPQEGDALYFVARGDGSHYFSSTLDEHNRAVIKYQLKGRKKSFSSFNGGGN
ncbi:FIG004453: protein YceG like [hydrothermal vent metagenome]|uniref:FIG004453: protein YceG like n=1 Tax=hydrothermal vent metagenome TaxID=652676 RepID=A0A3B1ADF4_9ZZZZ